MAISIDIVLPCYNPGAAWSQNIVDSFQELVNIHPDVKFGLIIVNDGSNKKIQEDDLQKIRNTVECFNWIGYIENKGKGFALRKGVQLSEATYILYTDIDFPYEIQSVSSIINTLLKDDVDIIAGSRGEAYYEKVPFVRIMISKVLRFFNRTFLNMKIYDTQCGLKAFNQKGKNIFLETTINRYLFDLEFVYLASNAEDIKIIPVNVQLKPGVVFSKMNFKVLRSELMSFIGIVRKHYSRG
ncbi:MAG: glycosyltransferase [Cytophagaceae bacterium]